MKKSRLKNLHDYLALIVRRRWWVISTIVALCGLTALIALLMPKSYTSQTMILIQPRDVPNDFVKDLIGGNTDERLSAIEQTILSRTNLLKIVDEFGDRLPEYQGLNDERKVLKLKKRIAIEFPSERRRGVYLPTTNILISYRDRNQELAQKITAQLASFFIEQDNRAREGKVYGTAEFFETEVKKVADELKKSEDALTALKQRYRYEMPSEQETNLRTLDRLGLQQIGNTEALDRYVTLQMNLERQISETPPVIYPDTAGKTVAGKPPNPQIEEYRKKEQAYKELMAKAKPSHPDARRLKAELDQLKKEIPPEDLAAAETSSDSPAASKPNPVYQSLTAQLAQLKTDIGIREKEKGWIAGEIAKYNQRVQSTPQVQQEMLAITRTNEVLTKQHDELKGKLEDAKLAVNAERSQKGASFTIIDRANYPMEPSPPSRLFLLLVGFGISLGAGVLAAVVVNSLNQKVWTHHELERALEAPVLVEIPAMNTPADARRALRLKLAHAFLFFLCSGVYLGGIYYLYHSRSAVLHLLDPIIEKIEERASS
jgi:succinoglycan biosynthesis transport protein ExoP